MEKLSQTLVSKLTGLQKRFEAFLENDFDHKVEEINKLNEPFEASRDVALVRGLSQGLPEDHIDRAIVVFSRLALLFDAGILLENHDGKWRPQAQFHKGTTQLIKGNSKLVISLPTANIMTILKTDAAGMLAKMQLQQLDPQGKTSCLLIKVSPDFAFLLFSEMADLWLKEHAENVRRALINGFAD